MELSDELISQFAKVTNDDSSEVKNGVTVNGTAVAYNGKIYVRLDGSDQLTPVISSTTGMRDGDRVTVLIKDHTATVTGNTSSPSAGSGELDDLKGEIGDQIAEFEIIIADKVSAEELEVEKGRIDDLVSENILVKEKLTATEAEIKDLTADNVTIKGDLEAQNAEIEDLKTTKLDAEIADLKYATIENLDATNADIHNLEADYGEFKDLTADRFTAIDADIKDLDAEKLSADEAEIKFANIDFANIGKAAIENFFSKSGMIGDLVVGDGTITGTLVGITIKGDLIEGGTVVADKLVIKGTDGLYYKLNTDGETVGAQQTEYNSLNGSVITAKSITAEKISVKDLVAFGATIGGFHITDSALYSGVKESVDNTTRGTYMDDTGQFAIGDSQNYLKFFKDQNGKWKLSLSASEIVLGTTGQNVEDSIGDTVVSTVTEYYVSNSSTELTGGKWSEETPKRVEGKYIWSRIKTTKKNGSVEYSNPACITGNSGEGGGLEGLEIGGRNLLRDTKLMSGISYSSNVTIEIDSEEYGVASFAAVENTVWNGIKFTNPPILLSKVLNKNLTISFEVKSEDYEALNDASVDGLRISFDTCSKEGVRQRYLLTSFRNRDLSPTWERSVFTLEKLTSDMFTSGEGTIDESTYFMVQIWNHSVYRMDIRKVKLELGTIATDWTPAPEDSVYDIGGVNLSTGTAEMKIGSGKRPSGHWRKNVSGNTTASTIKIDNPPVTGITHGIRLTADGKSYDNKIAQDLYVDIIRKNTPYTLSAWVKASVKNAKVLLRPWYYSEDKMSGEGLMDVDTEWTHVSFTSTKLLLADVPYINASYVYFGGRTSDTVMPDGAYLDICGIKLEEGSVSTGWTPAPEDTNYQIGGTNLILDSRYLGEKAWATINSWNYAKDKISPDGIYTIPNQSMYSGMTIIRVKAGEKYTVSIDAATPELDAINTNILIAQYYSSNTDGTAPNTGNRVAYEQFFADLSTEWKRHSYSFIVPNSTAEKPIEWLSVGYRAINDSTPSDVMFKLPKLERGNKATDWTPAPEDVEQSVQNAQDTADKAMGDAGNALTQNAQTQAQLKILEDSISTLVTDENGQSLMTQTGSGWSFNIGGLQSGLNKATSDIVGIQGDISQVEALANKTNQLANDIAEKTAYINMATDEEGRPCMELGKTDSLFKLRITNESIDFLQGTQKIAYIRNNQLYIKSSVVTDEMQIGTDTKGFVWKMRANGNMGLRWKG